MKRIWRYIYIQWPTKVSSFRLPAVKRGEAASWFLSDWKLEVIYVTIKLIHANPLGKLLLTSIRHTSLQPSRYLSGWLYVCGKLAEVLASKCSLTDCCSQTVDKSFKIVGVGSATYTALQKAQGLKALLQYTLIACFFPLLPTCVICSFLLLSLKYNLIQVIIWVWPTAGLCDSRFISTNGKEHKGTEAGGEIQQHTQRKGASDLPDTDPQWGFSLGSAVTPITHHPSVGQAPWITVWRGVTACRGWESLGDGGEEHLWDCTRQLLGCLEEG